MGRLVPAGTGMEYYRQVKIAGEDVVEEPVVEPALDAHPRLRRRGPLAVRRRPFGRYRRRHNSSGVTFGFSGNGHERDYFSCKRAPGRGICR